MDNIRPVPPPRFLQATLWSYPVEKLDLETDAVYIIHQVLSYGGLPEIKWLFGAYPESVIAKIFREKPMKLYRPAAFAFAKEILLRQKTDLAPNLYVINTPRTLG